MTNRTTFRVLAAATALLALGAGAGCSTSGASGADPATGRRGGRVLPPAVPRRADRRRRGPRDQPGQAGRRAARPGTQPAPGRSDHRGRADRLPARASSRRWTRRSSRTATATGRSTWPACSRCWTRPPVATTTRARRSRARSSTGTPRTRTSGSTRPGWPRIGDQLAQRLGTVDPDHAADYTARATALRADLTTLDAEFAAGPGDLPAAGDRDQPRRVRLPGRPVPTDQVGITGSHPGHRALAAAAGRGRRRGPGAPAPPRSSSRRWSARRSPRPSPARSGRRPRCSTRSKGSQPGSGADYLSVMRTNLPTLRTALELLVSAPVITVEHGAVGYDGRPVLRDVSLHRDRRRGGRGARRQRLRQVHADPRRARPGAAQRRLDHASSAARCAGSGSGSASGTSRSGSAPAAACRPPSREVVASGRLARRGVLRPPGAADRAAVRRRAARGRARRPGRRPGGHPLRRPAAAHADRPRAGRPSRSCWSSTSRPPGWTRPARRRSPTRCATSSPAAGRCCWSPTSWARCDR